MRVCLACILVGLKCFWAGRPVKLAVCVDREEVDVVCLRGAAPSRGAAVVQPVLAGAA